MIKNNFELNVSKDTYTKFEPQAIGTRGPDGSFMDAVQFTAFKNKSMLSPELINGKDEETNQPLDFETKQQAIDDKYNKQLEDANKKHDDKVHTADENYNSKADRINNAPLTDMEKSYLTEMSKYYEEYRNVTIYSKRGLTKDSYIVSACFDIKFYNQEQKKLC